MHREVALALPPLLRGARATPRTLLLLLFDTLLLRSRCRRPLRSGATRGRRSTIRAADVPTIHLRACALIPGTRDRRRLHQYQHGDLNDRTIIRTLLFFLGGRRDGLCCRLGPPGDFSFFSSTFKSFWFRRCEGAVFCDTFHEKSKWYRFF